MSTTVQSESLASSAVQGSQPRVCSATIRNQSTGMDEPCSSDLVRGVSKCPNYANHVQKYRTGFCQGKQCEGKRPKSPSGKPLKTCSFWLTCPCECHVRIAKMFAMAEEPRQILDNPEWIGGPQLGFVMPTRAEVFENVALKQIEVVVQKSDHEDIPDAVLREYAPTETGRAARGSLEQNVRIACDAWIKDGEPGECDTKYVSQWIYDNLGTPSLPSRGAIDAVWKRWVDLGFCMILHKPTQFVCYTPDAVKLGLEEMKARAKRAQRQKEQAIKLGRR